jgi:coenzyme F420-reducing hydrogenase delta subunit
MKNQSLAISLFFCSNSLSAEEISHCGNRISDVKLNSVSLPCSGKVNLLYLLKAIETGSDAVILATCKFGECKFLQGNFRAQKRTEALDELIEETGLGRGRVRFVQLEENNKTDIIVNEINGICKQLRTETQLVQE